MSAVLLNSGTKIKINKKSAQPHVKETVIKARMQSQSEIKSISETSRTEERNDEEAREERRATGRSVAIVIFLSLMCLAIYHVFDRKTTILASILVPAIILFGYTFFVIHISSRDKKRRKQIEDANDLELSVQSESKKHELQKKISTVSNSSLVATSHIPSTSDLSAIRIEPKFSTTGDPKALPLVGMKKLPPPFKKTQSQSHIPVQNNQSAAHVFIEHEKKKLKKSRSFDKNNYLDNKKIKTKH